MKYNDIILKHFKNPHNQGEIENPDGLGEAGNPVCGDVMQVFIDVKDDKIADIKFQTLGCGVAIATSSVLTDLAMGKSLDDAANISKADIIEELGGKEQVPPAKIHCSLLAEDALKKAIAAYRKKQK
ncbi:iron-sulfur cluster assembly scaffold protein [Patescibacteria group bacterium]